MAVEIPPFPLRQKAQAADGSTDPIIRHWLELNRLRANNAVPPVDDPGEDNFASLTSTGVIQDSGYDSTSFLKITGGTLTGDLIFSGSGTGLCYGSLYVHEGAVNIDITGVGVGVYVKITGFTTGLLNNVTINSDAFRVGKTGVYKVDWQIGGDSQGNNLIYEVDIFVNSVEQADGSSIRKFGAAADLGSFSGTGLIDITNTSHDLDLRIKQVGGVAGDLDIFNMNFNILQVGGT